MRGVSWAFLLLALATACSTVAQRKQAAAAAYEGLSAADRQLVDHGQIARGMDTNAVFIAWGSPSEVIDRPASSPPETIWEYSGNRAVHIPTWSYEPSSNGYWTYEPTTVHYSERYTRAEVVFQNGRVVDFKKFKAR